MLRQPLRIYSWNVNGLRACAKKGFMEWLDSCQGRIVAVQEVRAQAHQLDEPLCRPPEWHAHFASAERAGYSGVGIYSRLRPDRIETSMGVGTFDREGRVQLAWFGKLLLVNAYFPNGNGSERDNSRVPYKLRFYRRLFRLLETERASGCPILVVGDLNIAHREIDLARPKQNVRTSGFLPEERAELERWLTSGWIDTFRHFQAGPGHYTWWSQRLGVRAKNIGWRLDYILASPGAMRFVRGARIHAEVAGSDHCPVSVDVDPAISARKP